MYKYRAYHCDIRKIEIIKETPRQLTYIERGKKITENKNGQNYFWTDTYDEAKRLLTDYKISDIDNYKRYLNARYKELERICRLSEA